MSETIKEEIYNLILSWGKSQISSKFSHDDMTKDMSLLGLDSIELVEICEVLETKTNTTIDIEWLTSCETLLVVVKELSKKLESLTLESMA